MTPPATPDVAAAVARMAPGGTGAAVIAPRRVAWVEGPDAEALLHGLLTADIAAIPVGGSAESLILSTHGHVIARMAVARDSRGAFTLVLDPPPAPDGVAVITAHHVSEDAEVIGPEEVPVLVAGGAAADALSGAGDLVIPGVIPGTVEVLVDDPAALAADRGIALVDSEALEAMRVAAGIPRIGVDTGEGTLVQEALLDRAVSYEKGCYLGQETVARLHYRGRPNRRLARIALDGPITIGAAILSADGGIAGEVTSVADVPGMGWTGLGMVRREVADGDTIEVAGVTGTVLPPE